MFIRASLATKRTTAATATWTSLIGFTMAWATGTYTKSLRYHKKYYDNQLNRIFLFKSTERSPCCGLFEPPPLLLPLPLLLCVCWFGSVLWWISVYNSITKFHSTYECDCVSLQAILKHFNCNHRLISSTSLWICVGV